MRKFTFNELQDLAERDDFGEILTAAGVPDTPILENEITPKKWGEGVEFDHATFDEAAYQKYP
jgi:hypothetical protein